jgi:hypothetical protein
MHPRAGISNAKPSGREGFWTAFTLKDLLQRNQRAEAAGAALFGAVGKPILCVTGRADFGDFDVFNPSPFQQDLIRLP